MSRLLRYKESLQKFIKDRSCLLEKKNIPNEDIETLAYDAIKGSDLILPILLLTVMNNQNKKKHISIQGYHGAVSIEFMSQMVNIIDGKEEYIEKYGSKNYAEVINYMMLCTNKSLYNNLESVKDSIVGDLATKIFLKSIEVYNEKMTYENLLNNYEFRITEEPPNDDIIKWYFKENEEVIKIFSALRKIEKASFEEYMEKKVGSLCEIALSIGWIIGCGDVEILNKIIKLSKNFAILYKLSNDFSRLEEDILKNKNGVVKNYVVNYGLQESYEAFMENKQKFLEEVMTLDIYTSTIKEIMRYIENKVDEVVDGSSPELKSYCSSVME